jgi:uncharacterized membrane protein
MLDTTHIHPMIVHFPIALLIIGFLFDFVGEVFKKEFFGKAAFYLLLLGTLGVVAAYISGNIAGGGITEAGSLKNAIEVHEEAALLTLWIMVITSIARVVLILSKKYSGMYKWLALFMFLIGVLSVARTGYYGGELVFKHAAGVKFNLGNTFNLNDSEDNSNIKSE